MTHANQRISILALILLLAWCCALSAAEQNEPIRFNRDVRPILSNKCFRCHGPDSAARQADLRLDLREVAIAAKAIVPGDTRASELIERITAEGESVMPPRDSGLALGPREKLVLRKWIEQGAKYESHWSLVPVESPQVPAVKSQSLRNPIDHFVMAALGQRGLAPAPAADAGILLRRASLALTGLPPTPEELDAFLSDPAPDTYERAVDRLLASPRFGERMASVWLDAARYADTNGYFGDNPRQIWPWRDWVIAAFNDNVPFDQFTVEQLAGDLLPGATTAQKTATGFNRNHTVTDETGVIDEEYRVEYVADRVETTAAVWLGLTVGCARCHDHKFDPITQRDYYRLFAYFNNGPETGLAVAHDQPPTLALTTLEQQAGLEKLRKARSESEAELARHVATIRDAIAAWERTAADELRVPTEQLAAHFGFEPDADTKTERTIRPTAKGSEVTYEAGILGRAGLLDASRHFELPNEVWSDLDRPWSVGLWIKPTGSLNCVLSKVEPTGARRGVELLWAKGRLKLNLVHQWGAEAIEVATKEAVAKSGWRHVVIRSDGSQKAAGISLFVDGKAAELKVDRDSLRHSINHDQPLRIGRRDNGLGYYGHVDELRVFHRAISADEVTKWFWSDRLRGILALPADQRDAASQIVLRDYYLEHHGDEPARSALREVARARAAEEAFQAALPKTLVMQERSEPRTTHILNRGQYDQPGDAVQAGLPAALQSSPLAPREEVSRTRLDLARWIVSPENPLTARVAVNRLWQIGFGEGLVRTPNDFGSQGEPPTHPELLDWLAAHFARGGWNVKAMLRLIVTSATFQQSSVPSRTLLAADPENRWLARGPRARLPAEMIRDQALFASGLLSERVGGPSVKPWQPPGLWEAVSYDGDASYVPDRGEGLWRRSLYTYWKRQSPPPALLIFDAPTRETCAVHRPRTNTPAQALVLLNDESYVAAARNLAWQNLAVELSAPVEKADLIRVKTAFRRATCRDPDERECDILLRLLAQQRKRFASDPAAAEALVQQAAATGNGADRASRTLAAHELAAWTAVSQVILNLDEVLTIR